MLPLHMAGITKQLRWYVSAFVDHGPDAGRTPDPGARSVARSVAVGRGPVQQPESAMTK